MKTNLLSQKTIMGLLLGLSVGAVVYLVGLLFPTLYEDFENKTYDLRFSWHVTGPSPLQALEDVIIVDVDEESIAKLGRFFQWPRLYHAEVIRYLKEGGVSAVGFDMFFLESDSPR